MSPAFGVRETTNYFAPTSQESTGKLSATTIPITANLLAVDKGCKVFIVPKGDYEKMRY